MLSFGAYKSRMPFITRSSANPFLKPVNPLVVLFASQVGIDWLKAYYRGGALMRLGAEKNCFNLSFCDYTKHDTRPG